mmetsp:Transcript_130650/g.354556  ORF Transcript_130650/g.354556 Transcript_130650/m.354556 type:complete len:100 (+) Transcript_130650:238-537(+)
MRALRAKMMRHTPSIVDDGTREAERRDAVYSQGVLDEESPRFWQITGRSESRSGRRSRAGGPGAAAVGHPAAKRNDAHRGGDGSRTKEHARCKGERGDK